MISVRASQRTQAEPHPLQIRNGDAERTACPRRQRAPKSCVRQTDSALAEMRHSGYNLASWRGMAPSAAPQEASRSSDGPAGKQPVCG